MDINIDRRVQTVFEDETLAKSGTETSVVIDLQQTKEDDITVQYKFSAAGAGTLDIEVTESDNNSDWELNGAKIGTGLKKADAESGIYRYTSLKGAAFIKIIITETGGVSPVTVSIYLCAR